MWNRELTIKLIEELHSRPLLWDVTESDYKNRNKKRDALQEIAEHFKVGASEIENKIKSLKTQFRREHKSLCAKRKSGSSPKKSVWFGYEYLLFLFNTKESRGSRSTVTEADYQEECDFQEDEDFTHLDVSDSIITPSEEKVNQSSPIASTMVAPDTPIFRIPPQDSRKRRHDQAEEAYNVMDMKDNAKRDEYTVFGELVANKLRKCGNNPRSLAIAQHKINEILFNLEMEQFST